MPNTQADHLHHQAVAAMAQAHQHQDQGAGLAAAASFQRATIFARRLARAEPHQADKHRPVAALRHDWATHAAATASTTRYLVPGTR